MGLRCKREGEKIDIVFIFRVKWQIKDIVDVTTLISLLLVNVWWPSLTWMRREFDVKNK